MNKNVLILIVSLGIVAILLIVLAVSLLLHPSDAIPSDQSSSSSTAFPTRYPRISPLPTPVSNPPIEYKKDTSDLLLEKIQHKVRLSPQNMRIKQQLIQDAGGRSAELQKTNLYIISYFQPADVFQVEILSPDVATAKSLAANWFLSQGFSNDALCDLPVMFYLNNQTAINLKDTGMVFNSLADNCIN